MESDQSKLRLDVERGAEDAKKATMYNVRLKKMSCLHRHRPESWGGEG